MGADLQLVCSEAILAAVRRHFGTVSIPRSTDSSSSTDSCRSSGGSSSNSSSGGSTSNSSGNNDSDSTATTAGTTNSLVVKDAEEGKTRATAAADAAAAATPTSGLVVTGSDLMEGLRRVRPSALREVRICVCFARRCTNFVGPQEYMRIRCMREYGIWTHLGADRWSRISRN